VADRTIRIERLRVRLHGAPAEVGGQLGQALGQQLATRLAAETAGRRPIQSSIARLGLTVPPANGPLDGRVANAVAGAIGDRLPAGGAEPGGDRR
jgi:hypothetical protein